jgi:circadian clock protein KaiC
VVTGVEGLDEVLGGGIPVGSTVFITGLPGTGKTVLSQQLSWANAMIGERVLYLSTLSEPVVKILRFASEFGFFNEGLVGTGVVYGEIGGSMKTGGPEATLAEIDRLVKEVRPHVIVIDSYKVIRELFDDAIAFRAFTTELVVRLSLWEVTAVFVGEYNDDDIRGQPEFAIADGIIHLLGTEDGLRQQRRLRLMKMRGADFFGGDHLFDITADGILLYPRMRPDVVGEYRSPTRRLGSAVTDLDAMLGGGIFDSTSTLIYGSAGSGKTLTALSFLVEAARGGTTGLLVSLEEGSDQIARNAREFGWQVEDLVADGVLDVVHISPSELNIDRHASMIKDWAHQKKAGIVAIDSISAMEASVASVEKYSAYLWAITDHFKRSGVTVVMTCEVGLDGGAFSEPPRRVSLFADTLIRLRSADPSGISPRTLSVVKVRGSTHETTARELVIDPPEIRIGEPVSAHVQA